MGRVRAHKQRETGKSRLVKYYNLARKMVVSDLFFLSFVKKEQFFGFEPNWFEVSEPSNFIEGLLEVCIILQGVQTRSWKDPVCLLWIIDDAFVYSEVSVRW